MKIEKINENQIRCLLTTEDLAEREIKMAEFLHGSENAKMLLQEVIQQAYEEYGFDVRNMPVMIDVIPTSPGCTVIVLTKTESDDVSELVRHAMDQMAADRKEKAVETVPENADRYMAESALLSEVIKFTHIAAPLYNGESTLYKTDEGRYRLVMKMEEQSKIADAAADYITLKPITAAMEAYFEEHFETVIKDNAVETLSQL